MDSTTTTTLDVGVAEVVTPSNAPAGGQQQAVEKEKLLTQQEVDRILAERLARQKEKYADYEELKAAAVKYRAIEDAQKTETQRTAERLVQLERERDEALAKATDRLIRAAFIAEAAKAGALHPGDVYALADIATVSVDEQGNVVGAAEAVQAVIAAGRVPLQNTQQAPAKPTPARLDGGAGGGARSAEKDVALTDEQLAVAQRLGISAEKYAARLKEIKAMHA
jgi:hypothetical protein